MGSIWPVLLFGLLLGMKHATEPDHVIAVSTIASRTKKLSLSSLAGMFWGIGHTLTLLVVGMVMIAFERQIPEQIASYLEMGVGIMIVILGMASFRSTMRLDHHHQGDIHHLHVKSTLIGIVHGLAGSAGMVLLTMTTVKGTWMALAFILIFGLGTVIGMMLFTTFLGYSVCLDESETASHESMDRENPSPSSASPMGSITCIISPLKFDAPRGWRHRRRSVQNIERSTGLGRRPVLLFRCGVIITSCHASGFTSNNSSRIGMSSELVFGMLGLICRALSTALGKTFTI